MNKAIETNFEFDIENKLELFEFNQLTSEVVRLVLRRIYFISYKPLSLFSKLYLHKSMVTIGEFDYTFLIRLAADLLVTSMANVDMFI